MHPLRFIGLYLAILLSPPALGLETMSYKQLVSWCKTQEVPYIVKCQSYITGFLDGAFATDPRVAQRALDEIEKRESFSERAARTRISAIQKRFGPSYYAGFCVPPEAPVEDIAKLVVSEADASEARDNAREYLYSLLQEHYRCQDN